jgi:hypothetical protein
MTCSAVQDPCTFLVAVVQNFVLLLCCISCGMHLTVRDQLRNMELNKRLQDGLICGVRG